MSNINFINTGDKDFITLEFSKVNGKFYLDLTACRIGEDGHLCETGDGIAIRVDLLKNFIDTVYDIAIVLPKEMSKASDPKLAKSA